MKSPDYNFDRVFDAHQDEKGVGLPESIEVKLLSDDPESPLSQISRRIKEAGISEESIQRYQGAIRAFTYDRKSRIQKGSYPSFQPQEHYFAPRITFDNLTTEAAPLPQGKREHSLKPHLSRGGRLEKVSISGQQALETFRSEPIDAASLSYKTTPHEAFMAQINRFMYSLHEPIHIYQALAEGDRLNRLKDIIGSNAFDPEKEKVFLKGSRDLHPGDLFNVTNILKESPFFVSENTPGDDKPVSGAPEKEGMFLIANNEATMDTLADRYCRELLRENPALMLYLHNAMVVMVEALKKMKEDAQKSIQENSLRALYKEISTHLGFISRAYFAAFDSSDDALSYFKDAGREMLGRAISGKLLVSEPFDPFEVMSLGGDVQALINILEETRIEGTPELLPEALKPYEYPSGARHYDFSHPITEAGAEFVSKFFVEASKRGMNGKEIQEILDTVNSRPLDQARVQAIQQEISAKVGLDFSEENVREMFGAADAMFIGDFEAEYPKRYYLRRKLIGRLEKENPELVRQLIQSCFFKAEIHQDEFFALTDFGNKNELGTWEKFSWDHLRSLIEAKAGETRSLSIFGIDATKLSQESEGRLKALLETNAETQEEKMSVLKELAQLKKEQAKPHV